LLGTYIRIGIEEARRKAWKCRLEVKGFSRPRKQPSGRTLEELFILYEDTCQVPNWWGRLRDKTFFALKPLVSRPWTSLSQQRVQKYIDRYVSPGSARMVVYALNKVLAWAEDSCLIDKASRPLVIRPIKRLGRRFTGAAGSGS
jgi:hypothetical protein